MAKEINTSFAFVTGKVSVLGLQGREQGPPVTIIGESVNDSARITVRPSEPYFLCLYPGSWTIYAEMGVVKTAKTTLILNVGDREEMNFTFVGQKE